MKPLYITSSPKVIRSMGHGPFEPEKKSWSKIFKKTFFKIFILGFLGGVGLLLYYRFSPNLTEQADRYFNERAWQNLLELSTKQLALDPSPRWEMLRGVASYNLNPQAGIAPILDKIAPVDNHDFYLNETVTLLLSNPDHREKTLHIASEFALRAKASTASDTLKKTLWQSLSKPGDLQTVQNPQLFSKLSAWLGEQNRYVNAKNLQLRATAALDAEVVRRLKNKENLLLRYCLNPTVVGDKKGSWCNVLDETLQTGFVFDGYLKK